MVLAEFGGASSEVSSIAESQAITAFIGLLVLSAAAVWWIGRVPRRIERSPSMWFFGFASLALVLAVTLFRDGVPAGFDITGLADWSADGFRLLARDPFGSGQYILNIVLFVPAGLVWTRLVRRPLTVLVGLVCLSLVVESIQATTKAGVADLADLAANTLGASIGVGVVTMIAATNRDRAPTAHAASRVRRSATGAIVIAVVVVAVLALFVGASRHQQQIEDSLRIEFEGTNRSRIDDMLAKDSNAVFGAAIDVADGTRSTEDQLEIRYPAAFFGLQRCVYVVWTSAGVEFRKASGRACTDFIDN